MLHTTDPHFAVLSKLLVAKQKNRLAHGLLFLGLDSNSKEKVALTLAKSLLCTSLDNSQNACDACQNCILCNNQTHPNVHRVLSAKRQQEQNGTEDGENNETIRIEQIRDLKREQRMEGYIAGAQIWLVIDAHLLTIQAANALLKTLEEPQNNQYLILLAPSLTSVLPTIASRCQRMVFAANEPSNTEPVWQPLLSSIVSTNVAGRIQIIDELIKHKDTLSSKLLKLSHGIMHLLRTEQYLTYFAHIETALHVLEHLNKVQILMKNNVNCQLLLEDFLLRNWPLQNHK